MDLKIIYSKRLGGKSYNFSGRGLWEIWEIWEMGDYVVGGWGKECGCVKLY